MNEDAGLTALYVAAASGDAESLGALTDVAVLHSLNGVPPREALAAAEVLSRLAAVNGGLEGKRKLAAVLLMRSGNLAQDDPSRAHNLMWQAIETLEELASVSAPDAGACLLHHLSAMADAGDEDAAMLLNTWSDRLPATVVAAASGIARNATEVVG